MKNPNVLYGITPVQQCLLHQNRSINQLFVKAGGGSTRIKEIINLANKNKVPVIKADAHKLAVLSKTKQHQGVVLSCGELKTHELDDFLENLINQKYRLLIALDQVEDPQNVGTVIRSAAFLGADGIITLKKNSAPLSATVSKASAGALEFFPVISVANLSESLQKLKREGFMIVGAASDGNSIDFQALPDFNDVVLVMGNEGRGLRTLTQKRCEYLVHIPGKHTVESLNVSAAAAILIQSLAKSV